MDPALEVQNLSKRFFRNPDVHGRQTVRDLFREMLGKTKGTPLRPGEFYALRGLSFEMKKGETLALIGRNGCGKTTALKLITGLLKPDYGRVVTRGNVQALIALGAGFNPKLSGRENIVNAAAILGLRPRQVRSVVGSIIEFAELEEFIDSPVRTYSSGMYARLGFSVAVHLEPDILIIDEILGVGDYAFQNKCFLRMQELKGQGATIVLVSHSHAKVVQMCERAIWLDRGNTVLQGDAKTVVDKYIKSMESSSSRSRGHRRPEASTKVAASEDLYGPIHRETGYIRNLKCTLSCGATSGSKADIRPHEKLVVEYEFELMKEVSNLNVSLNIVTLDGTLITTISTLNGDLLKQKRLGRVHCRVTIGDLCITPGSYVVTLPIHDGHSYLHRDVVGELRVVSGDRMTWGLIDLNYTYELLA